jgi:hypothetical protein
MILCRNWSRSSGESARSPLSASTHAGKLTYPLPIGSRSVELYTGSHSMRSQKSGGPARRTSSLPTPTRSACISLSIKGKR